MRAVTGDLPKALLPIGPQPFIDWQLQWLKRLGIDEVVLALGHRSSIIETHLQENKESPAYPRINYSYDGAKLLGTGGAIRKAAPLLEDDFIVTYGDTFLFIDPNELMKTHRQEKKGMTLAILENKNIGDKSNVVFEQGRIQLYDKFRASPRMQHIDYGMSVNNKRYFLDHAPAGKFDYADTLKAASEAGQVAAFAVQYWFQEVGSMGGYSALCELFEQNAFDLDRIARSNGLLRDFPNRCDRH